MKTNLTDFTEKSMSGTGTSQTGSREAQALPSAQQLISPARSRGEEKQNMKTTTEAAALARISALTQGAAQRISAGERPASILPAYMSEIQTATRRFPWPTATGASRSAAAYIAAAVNHAADEIGNGRPLVATLAAHMRAIDRAVSAYWQTVRNHNAAA